MYWILLPPASGDVGQVPFPPTAVSLTGQPIQLTAVFVRGDSQGFTVELQQSDTQNGTFERIGQEQIFGDNAGNEVRKVIFRRTKPWVRAAITDITDDTHSIAVVATDDDNLSGVSLMSLSALAFAGNTLGSVTAAANTIINALVPPRMGAVARVSTIRATAAATAHTLTALRSIGRTKVAAAAAAAQAVVTLLGDPGVTGNLLAANDWLAIRTRSDGITRLYRVSSITGLAVTLTGNLAVALAIGDDVWNFGIAADTHPRTGTAHPTFALGASAQTTLTDVIGGVAQGLGTDEPVLLQSNNATNAGSIDYVSYSYTRE